MNQRYRREIGFLVLCMLSFLFLLSFPVYAEQFDPTGAVWQNDGESGWESNPTLEEDALYHDTEIGEDSDQKEDFNSPEDESEETDANLLEDIVYNEQELKDWLNAHTADGGTVTLGDHITITSSIVSNYSPDYVTIDTGEFGLIYDGGILLLENYMVMGEGVNVPVIELVDAGGRMSSWNMFVQDIYVTAYGKDGMGGTALQISHDNGYTVNLAYIYEGGKINSYGTGAIGVKLLAPVEAYCLNVEVEGENATAVFAPEGATLYYCRLSSSGSNAEVVGGSGEFVLNTCDVTPLPQNAEIINYHIENVIGRSFYFPVKHNSEQISYFDDVYTFLLVSDDGTSSEKRAFKVYWETPPSEADTEEFGKTQIKGGLDVSFQGLGLEDRYTIELTVDVRDPNIPCISELSFFDKVDGKYAGMFFWEDYGVDNENFILWRSDNGGETWYDYTNSPDIEMQGYFLMFFYDEITNPITFQIEVLGQGESNVVTMSTIDQSVITGLGGDRTGTDRAIENPEEETEDEENTQKEEGSSSSGSGTGSDSKAKGKNDTDILVAEANPVIAFENDSDLQPLDLMIDLEVEAVRHGDGGFETPGDVTPEEKYSDAHHYESVEPEVELNGTASFLDQDPYEPNGGLPDDGPEEGGLPQNAASNTALQSPKGSAVRNYHANILLSAVCAVIFLSLFLWQGRRHRR